MYRSGSPDVKFIIAVALMTFKRYHSKIYTSGQSMILPLGDCTSRKSRSSANHNVRLLTSWICRTFFGGWFWLYLSDSHWIIIISQGMTPAGQHRKLFILITAIYRCGAAPLHLYFLDKRSMLHHLHVASLEAWDGRFLHLFFSLFSFVCRLGWHVDAYCLNIAYHFS